jgi:hypothetical protein
MVVVQEGLALPHEDEIDALAFEVNLMIVENSENLADDFSRSQISLDAKKGGHTELTVDRASDLTGDTDGSAVEAPSTLLFVASFGAVTGFTAVALWHPDSLYGLAIGKADQIAHGTIDGDELLLDLREANGPIFLYQALPIGLGESGNLGNTADSLAVQSLV